MAPFSCARAAMERSEAIFATASGVRRWLLVEVRGPWGHNAALDSDLGDFVDKAWLATNKERGIRTLNVRRNLRRASAGDSSTNGRAGDGGVELIYIDPAVPGGRAGRAWHRVVDGLPDVAAATADLPGVARSGEPEGWAPWDRPLTLVCTHGRHDSCCATFGRPTIRHLRESRWADSAWETSHVGGDRFAANLVLLPDSLYFGRCDPESAEAVLEAYEDGRIHLSNYRGRSTLGFTQQAAEYFVRTEVGLDRLDAVGGVHRLEQPKQGDGASTLRFRVATGRGTADGHPRSIDDVVGYDVTLERTTQPSPTPLTCKGNDGVSYPVYRLVDLTESSENDAADRPAGEGSTAPTG